MTKRNTTSAKTATAAKSLMSPSVLRATLDRLNSLSGELSRLNVESGEWSADITTNRQVDRHNRRFAKIRAEFRTLAAIPEVNAAVLKLEAKE